jgi:O-antigen ligase
MTVSEVERAEPPVKSGGTARALDYERLESAGLPVLAGIATVALAFANGGFFPTAVSATALAVLFVLVARVVLAREPMAGIGLGAFVAIGALALLAAWTLVSSTWAPNPAEAVIDFDRALLACFVLGLFAAGGSSATRAKRLVRSLALAILLVGLVALASRLLPELLTTPLEREPERLSYPLTYWNALGLMLAIGLAFWLHLASSAGEPAWVRAAAAAAFPPLSAALLLTFSRGALLIAVVGLVVYVALARSRGLLGAMLAIVPPTALALNAAYGASLVASDEFTSPAGVAEGSGLALTIVLCAAAAAGLRAGTLPLDALVGGLPRTPRRATGGLLAVLAVLGLVVGAGALDAETRVREALKEFSSERMRAGGDTRDRLGSAGSPGRVNKWRVALEGYEAAPLVGQGGGSYASQWAQRRPNDQTAVNAHSLPLETLAELGLVGLALLVLALAVLLGGLARRCRGRDRGAWPATGLWLFAAGGLALARTRPQALASPSARRPESGSLRLAVAGALIVCGLTPALAGLSELRLDRAKAHFVDGNCPAAIESALSANSLLSVRAEPFELLGYCDARLGKATLGVKMMEEAVARGSGDWQTHYGLALLRGAAGIDPRAAARAALARDPRSPLTRDLVRSFDTDMPDEWRKRALDAPLPPAYRGDS